MTTGTGEPGAAGDGSAADPAGRRLPAAAVDGQPGRAAPCQAAQAGRPRVQHEAGQRHEPGHRGHDNQAARRGSPGRRVRPRRRARLSAGHETTTGLIGNTARRLLEDPRRWAAVAAQPDLIPAAIEETLRFDPSVPGWRRVTTRPATLAGVERAPGLRQRPALLPGHQPGPAGGRDRPASGRRALPRPSPR